LPPPAQTLDASTIEAQCPDDHFGEITKRSTMPAQIIATEPTIEKRGEAMLKADAVAITRPNDAEDVPVGAIQPSHCT
jgi:hypothetical protein